MMVWPDVAEDRTGTTRVVEKTRRRGMPRMPRIVMSPAIRP